MTHTPRRRPEGRYQCTACRAAFLTLNTAHHASFPCPGLPLAHGPLGLREHLVYPTWSKRRDCATWGCDDPDCPGGSHGPDPLCDELTCRRCMHACDCDVCTGTLTAPDLNILRDSREP